MRGIEGEEERPCPDDGGCAASSAKARPSARGAVEPDGFAAPIGGTNREGPRCGPSLFVASLMCESWNHLLEWLGEVAVLCAGDS